MPSRTIVCLLAVALFIQMAAYASDLLPGGYDACRDPITATYTVDETLDTPFFHRPQASHAWYVVVQDNGNLERIDGEPLSKVDTIPLEHTADVISSHQGEHRMSFCQAWLRTDYLEMEVTGGMPAYASSLLIRVQGKQFTCHFKAVYPAPVKNLSWEIVSKWLTIKNPPIGEGKRLYAKFEVEFKESGTYQGKTTISRHRIKGYLKPVVTSAEPEKIFKLP